MPTPSKNLLKYAGTIPKVQKELKEILKTSTAAKVDVDNLYTRSFQEQQEILHNVLDSIISSTNKIVELTIRQEHWIKTESAAIQQELLYSQDELDGLHKIDSLNINSCLYMHSPRLCARVGYDIAVDRLKKLSPTGDYRNKVGDRAFCYCFGFEGTECHFVEFWRDAKPQDGGKALKTNGHLEYSLPFTGYYWYQCEKFLRAYYENYYVDQIKGKIKAVSNRKVGKVVQFL